VRRCTSSTRTGSYRPDNWGKPRAWARSKLICDRASARAEQAGVKCESHVVPGDAADALVDVAEQLGADLIVIGNRGMTGVRRFVLGSVPNKVSHHCPCSLMIVDTRS
jgi:nucleotide-binding universal stress UspA family protein